MGVRTSLLAITPVAATQTAGLTSFGEDSLGNYEVALLKLEEAIILLNRVHTNMVTASDANAANVQTQITNLT